MGTIIKNIFPCLHEDKKLGRINKNELSGSFGDFINTSNGEFFCHKCSAKTPEIAEILLFCFFCFLYSLILKKKLKN
jgi:hypothetical protein